MKAVTAVVAHCLRISSDLHHGVHRRRSRSGAELSAVGFHRLHGAGATGLRQARPDGVQRTAPSCGRLRRASPRVVIGAQNLTQSPWLKPAVGDAAQGGARQAELLITLRVDRNTPMFNLFKRLTELAASPLAASAAQRAAARQILRQTAQPGSGGRPWTRVPERPQDRVLSDCGVSWARGLPATARPNSLMQTYPRLANRLALCWADPALAKLLLDELFADRRGGRKGFPRAVASELQGLRWHLSMLPSRRSALGLIDPWRAQATADR